MSETRRNRKQGEKNARFVKQRLVFLISSLIAIIAILIFRVGQTLWPLWLVEYRSRIIALLLFALIFAILLSPIIIEFSRNPRALSGPGKNPYIDP